jgi:hypothetical protein
VDDPGRLRDEDERERNQPTAHVELGMTIPQREQESDHHRHRYGVRYVRDETRIHLHRYLSGLKEARLGSPRSMIAPPLPTEPEE